MPVLITVAHKANIIIYFPVQQHLIQYNNIYSSTKLFIPVQICLSQYNIYPSAKLIIPVQKYFSSTKILIPVQKYFSSTNGERELISQRLLQPSLKHMRIWQQLSQVVFAIATTSKSRIQFTGIARKVALRFSV